MRPDEVRRALTLLPLALRHRAECLHLALVGGRCERCRAALEKLHLALTAAQYDEYTAAARLIDEAEARVRDPHTVADCPAAARPGRTGPARGVVNRWARRSTTVFAATDASWKQRTVGIAYVASNGEYGLRGWHRDPRDPSGPSRVLINELRAVEFLLAGLADRVTGLTVLVDSTTALSYLGRWRDGETGAMPAGYSLRPRRRAVAPTLVRLAELVHRRRDIVFTHVKGHTGHPLNEAADALSSMARRRVSERFDFGVRAEALVDSFLIDWHRRPAASRLDTHVE
jgi:hypothetical protein